MTADERESLEDVARVTASLDQPAALESSTTLGELVAPDDSDFVADVEETMVYDRVREAVERLPGLQRDVLRLRFGFDGDSPASLQSTAERLGVGRPPGAPGRGGGAGCAVVRRRRARRPRGRLSQVARRLQRSDADLDAGLSQVALRSSGSGDVNSTRAPVAGWAKPSLKACRKKRPDPRRLSATP